MRRLVLAALVGVLTTLLAVPVAAAPPEISTEIVDETVPDEFLSEACGFPVTVTASGMTRVRTWLDAEGNPTREIFTIMVRGSISAGGQTLHFTDAGMDKAIFLEGGGVWVEVHGELGMAIAKGRDPSWAGPGGLCSRISRSSTRRAIRFSTRRAIRSASSHYWPSQV